MIMAATCYMNLHTGETTFSEWQAVLWLRDGFTVINIYIGEEIYA